MNRKASVLAAVSAIASSAALACGVCIDDKVAAVYDHAQVQQAFAKGRVVVFCELAGAHDPGTLSHRAGQAAQRLSGVERGSVRASNELPVVSFVLDPGAASPGASVGELRKRLQHQGITPTLLKVLRPR